MSPLDGIALGLQGQDPRALAMGKEKGPRTLLRPPSWGAGSAPAPGLRLCDLKAIT